MKTSLWHQGHYNTIAKEIREELKPYIEANHGDDMAVKSALISLALSFAERFKKENPAFNPLKWLDQCSPDPEMYPISELWDD